MNSVISKVLLGTTLALLVAVIVLLGVHFAPASFYGTYCTGEQVSSEDLYIVLQKDGSYTLYRQFELLAEGTYQVDRTTDGVSILSLASGGASSTGLAIHGDSVLLLDDSGDSNVFQKISDTPLFINLQGLR